MKQKPFSHLTQVDRCRIEAMLSDGKSINRISKELDKSPSTILREIRKHSKEKETASNDCSNTSLCKNKHLCGSQACVRLCKKCKYKSCKDFCNNYQPLPCPVMPKTGVCNACKKAKTKCKYRKVIYRADKANNEYRSLLISSRNGTSLTGKELDTINKIVSEPIKNGQSPYQVITANKDKLPVSESTIRRLISSGELEARNIDLRNQVSRRKRRNSKTGKNETGITVSKLGHLHDDYLRLISHNDVSVVQMDCVEGSADSESVLLTLHLPEYHLQIAEILSHHTSECVVGALDKIESALGRELFTEIFEVILTDNGHEFSDIEAIEKSCFGGKRTKVFFCEPNRSDQKGECECNHKYIRYIIPKGTSMDHLSQFDINLMMNHINSSRRKSLRGKSPYQVAKAVLPEDFFILLGLEEIPDNEIILTPKLLKKSK